MANNAGEAENAPLIPASLPLYSEHGSPASGPVSIAPVTSAVSAYPPFPRHVAYVIANELCERFSYYGLKAILAVYFVDHLRFSEDGATQAVHTFIFACYAFSLIGGYVADCWWGKYRTIFYLSVVYVVGGCCLAATALPGATGTPPHWWGVAVSLLILAMGTGGIKPCVSAFVGEQFVGPQCVYMDTIFYIFYFSINAGSLMSTLLTPLVKHHFSFAAAFAVPAVLLVVALVLFVAGRKDYICVPPDGNVYATVWHVLRVARTEHARRSPLHAHRTDNVAPAESVPRAELEPAVCHHWVDMARAECSEDAVEGVKSLLSAASVFSTIPVFWALFDQHSSRWIFQARGMDLLGGAITASQVPALNPVLLLLLIPLFSYAQRRAPCLAIVRMAIGMVLTALAFVAAAIVQMRMDVLPLHSLSVLWQVPQYVLLCCGEILVSVTGLEFAFSQARPDMKGVVMALWLLTVAIGNALVVVVAALPLPGAAAELWFFAILMLVFAVLFWWLNKSYTYRESTVSAGVKRHITEPTAVHLDDTPAVHTPTETLSPPATYGSMRAVLTRPPVGNGNSSHTG